MYQNVKNVCYFTPDTKQEHSQRPVAHFSGHSYSRSTHGGCALLLLWYSRGEVSAGLNVCMNMKRCNAESGLTRGSGLVCCSPRSSALQTRTVAAMKTAHGLTRWKEPSPGGTGGRTQACNILKHQRSALTSALVCRVPEKVQAAMNI